MHRGKKKPIEELSPTCGHKVDVLCPSCNEVRNTYYRSVYKAGHTNCRTCTIKNTRRIMLPVGMKYNRLTVLNESSRSGYSLFKCDCGTEKEISDWMVENERTKSCGCLRSENMSRNSVNPKNEEHWNWKGGIASEREAMMSRKVYKDWRSEVFARDAYTCQKCEQVGYEIRAHHILNYSDHPDSRLCIDNGITLCEACHREFHTIYGYKTDKEQLKVFLER